MDIATLIVDLLRKKEEQKALNKGGLTLGTPESDAALAAQGVATGPTPTPGMLGSGMAQQAAIELLRKKSAPMEYVDSVQ